MKKRILALLLTALLLSSAIIPAALATSASLSFGTCPTCGQTICECCEICGAYPACEDGTHVKCATCGEYDCTKEHVQCEICKAYDCADEHVYCDVCAKYDCGVDHSAAPTNDGIAVIDTGDTTGDEATDFMTWLAENATLYDPVLTGTFADTSVDCYYNPVTMPELVLSATVSAETEFTAGFSFTYEGTVWYFVTFDGQPEGAVEGLDENQPYSYVKASELDLGGDDSGGDDGPVVINTCAICGTEGCTTAHLYCPLCKEFDCGETHTPATTEKPATSPVIPTNPTLTSGADVSIADASGNAVTASGCVLPEGKKVSLSAWTNLSGASYQWQLRYDAANDLWVDIAGQTGKGILLSPATVRGIVSATGSAVIRCQVTSGATVQYSANIPLTVAKNSTTDPELYGMMRKTFDPVTADDTSGLYNYNIVINYVFEDNTIVADPYTATLAAGSNFSATVNFPTVQGYLPYVGEATETSSSLELNITDIQADVTYTVTYKPTNVDYTVIHYKQNVDNDNYSIAETETLQGLTNSDVLEVAKAYTGFYALLYEKPTIAADGSTVVEIYYDRNYYLMNFELDGGYGVEPIYARFGSPISVGTPTKAGYTFTGWVDENDETATIPSTMPAANSTYTAEWQVGTTAQVKVVFWGENPNDEEYSYLTTGVINATPGTPYTFADGNSVFLICGKEEHTHTAACGPTCGKEEHITHTDDCIACGKTSHSHNVTCYTDDGAAFSGTLGEHYVKGTETNGSIGESYVFYGFGESATGNKYIYIDGTWYKYTGSQAVGTIVAASCGDEEHTHTDACLGCEVHAHSASCYSCGKEEHTHDNTCNQTGSGLDSNLWTFVRSETVTVAADGSSVVNVYYDRTTFTMTFKEQGYNGDTLATITDKWGADIKTRFETISKANTFFWSASSNGGDPWTSFMDIMPEENRTYYADPQSGSTTLTATYLVENLAGTGYETLYTVTFQGSSSINVTEEEFVAIEGFTFNDGLSTDTGDDYNGAKFYYDRHHYAIEYYSPTVLLKTTTGVPYESPLTSYDWTPDASQAPAQYEPGSVAFEGWYLNPECTGEKFDFTTHTMPAGTKDGDTTLTLYAKWVPVDHTVEFYLDKTAYEAGTELSTHPIQTVSHGEKISVADPTNGSYTFVGWFYMDNGVEKAFDFDNMPINKDMKVYGKWSSNVLKEYTVYFKINGTDTEIAKPITGSALAGTTKTFEAKGGEELYEGYQAGYFPLVKSHSLTIDINATEENDTNVYTFYYVQKDAVPYTVYYVTDTQNEDGTLEEITLNGETYYIVANTYTNSENRKAVVTEKFVVVPGYMPDAYQKRLIVDGSDEAVNEIIFYYTEDTTHAYYKITHYTQNTDGQTWTEYASSQAIGDIGQTYTADPLTIDGFTYKADISTASGTLTASGLELKLYYVRNEYPYQVRYLEQGTGKQLAKPMDGTGMYGKVISESAIDIEGYTAVAPTSQTLTIKIEENNTAKLNIITFYYTEQEVTLNYVVVGPNGCGTVTPDSETVKVVTGEANGSTATASSNVYKFVGWYSDEDCENLLSTDAKYVPTKDENELWEGATYYAKFEYNLTELTIKKTGAQDIDENQSFIFNVSGNGLNIDVVVVGNGSVTIKGVTVGEKYIITEKTGWSWRYTPDATSKELTPGPDAKDNVVEFSNNRSKIYWLGGDNYAINTFGVGRNQGIDVGTVPPTTPNGDDEQ